MRCAHRETAAGFLGRHPDLDRAKTGVQWSGSSRPRYSPPLGSSGLVVADGLLASWNGKPARGYGGTAHVVEAAKQRGVPVTVLWPKGAERD